jgi:hypothetical protein
MHFKNIFNSNYFDLFKIYRFYNLHFVIFQFKIIYHHHLVINLFDLYEINSNYFFFQLFQYLVMSKKFFFNLVLHLFFQDAKAFLKRLFYLLTIQILVFFPAMKFMNFILYFDFNLFKSMIKTSKNAEAG